MLLRKSALILVLGLTAACGAKGEFGLPTTPGPKATAAPELTISEPSAERVYAEREEVELRIAVTDADTALASLSLSWASSLDGELAGSAHPDDFGSASLVQRMSVGQHLLTVTATDPEGNLSAASVAVTVNGAPSAPVVEIQPGEPGTDDDLVAVVVGGAEDPEGDPLTYTWSWTLEGVGAGDTDTIAADRTEREQQWRVVVVASDGLQDSPSGSATALIGPPCDQDGDGQRDLHPDCGGEDCDDLDAGVYSGAIEDCYDGKDNDCDSIVDSCTQDLANAAAILEGVDSDDALGRGLAIAGDVNGDGWTDAWVGSDQAGTGASPKGFAYLHLGPLAGTVRADGGAAVVRGFTDLDGIGGSFAAPGDLDGDGFDDSLLGAPRGGTLCRGPTGGDCDEGEIWLMAGPLTGTLTAGAADHLIFGDDESALAGSALAWLADLDGDGSGELAIGAPGWSSSAAGSEGAVYLVSGPLTDISTLSAADSRIRGVAVGDRFGLAQGLINAGDTDGDGLDELAAAATWSGHQSLTPGTAFGAVYLWRDMPASGSNATSAEVRVVGQDRGDELGAALLGGIDLNGDGYDDLVASSLTAGGAGTVYVFEGPLVGGSAHLVSAASLVGEASSAQAGASIAQAGDVDGDGNEDLWVGAASGEGLQPAAGAALLVIGPFSGTVDLGTASKQRLMGEVTDDAAASRLAGGGDLDGDGILDLLLAAPGSDRNQAGAGAVYLWAGSDL